MGLHVTQDQRNFDNERCFNERQEIRADISDLDNLSFAARKLLHDRIEELEAEVASLRQLVSNMVEPLEVRVEELEAKVWGLSGDVKVAR